MPRPLSLALRVRWETSWLFVTVLLRPACVASTSTWRCHAFGLAPCLNEESLVTNSQLVSQRTLSLGFAIGQTETSSGIDGWD